MTDTLREWLAVWKAGAVGDEGKRVGWEFRQVAGVEQVPWNLVFHSKNSAFYSES